MWLAVFFLVVVAALIHFRPHTNPVGVEGFATTAVHPLRVPECVARSTDAQKLLARFAGINNDAAEELRLLVSKVCCMEADIATPSAGGTPRTLRIQFRTSHDMEPPSSLVGRCLRNAVNKRDIELIVEKFQARGHVLINGLCASASEKVEAHKELDSVVARLQMSMMSFCLRPSPNMDRPAGVRDVGFWEPKAADLPQYQGITAQPR
jgi:hypothetical protein